MAFQWFSAPFCTVSAQRSVGNGFCHRQRGIKPGLVIFRRGDVTHRNFYCRVRLPGEDRYKTIALKTADRETARENALDQYADIRFRLKHDVPVFNRPFRQVAEEYTRCRR